MPALTEDHARPMDQSPMPVTRRKVFYLPGYDPFPPRRYRELYRTESALQAKVSGYRIGLTRPSRQPVAGEGKAVGARASGRWSVEAEIGGERCEAEVTVLVWSDLVRQSMGQGILSTYLQLVRTAWVYIRSGALFRLARLRKGPTIAALYPVGLLLAGAIVAVAAGGVAGRAVAVAGEGLRLAPVAIMTLAVAAGVAVAAAVLWGLRRIDGRTFAFYLMHDYAHTAQHWGEIPADLNERLARFTAEIGAAMDETGGEAVDEVLVVGHSTGAHLAVIALADLIRERQARGASGGPALALLTLGQVVPMLSFLPRARRLRRDLAFLSASGDLTWVDVTAPGDGCAFALCDPVAVSGVAPPGKRWPLVLSAAFTRTLTPETWARLRWRFFRLHFQYLCAFDRPGDYDYFAITAGPRTLAARFAGRAPSRSRIEAPRSGFTSTDAAA